MMPPGSQIQPTKITIIVQNGTKGDVLNNVPDRMSKDFFIVIDIAGNDVDVLSSLALRKSGQRYALYFISQE